MVLATGWFSELDSKLRADGSPALERRLGLNTVVHGDYSVAAAAEAVAEAAGAAHGKEPEKSGDGGQATGGGGAAKPATSKKDANKQRKTKVCLCVRSFVVCFSVWSVQG